ncbi:Colicin V production accessory protein CvpA [Commensalibacter communis]|uniref:CvpA family protein n=1 Tax=Commensalibacter communis TaxID=2972786 RepID=UPI0022FF62D1|nr:CvpA family protein [Commensalibacter communis]CAI3951134.1 Colicin V production accessory protein CvpA [Commensalibacter communis]CAI3953254.1 Colicin V production accessory protein CvpA [Commensalibacter communis]
MNWIDLVCLGIIILSALSGLTRGFTREFIGLFGWVVAASLANRWYPDLAPKITPYISNETIADIASFATIFILCCIVINTLANVIVGQNSTRFSILGRLDRLLGAACGAVKGFATLAIIYIFGGIVFPSAQWPEILQESQMVPYVYQGAVYINGLLPSSMQRDIIVPQIKTPRTSYPTNTNIHPNMITDPNEPLPATGQHNPDEGVSPDY